MGRSLKPWMCWMSTSSPRNKPVAVMSCNETIRSFIVWQKSNIKMQNYLVCFSFGLTMISEVVCSNPASTCSILALLRKRTWVPGHVWYCSLVAASGLHSKHGWLQSYNCCEFKSSPGFLSGSKWGRSPATRRWSWVPLRHCPRETRHHATIMLAFKWNNSP